MLAILFCVEQESRRYILYAIDIGDVFIGSPCHAKIPGLSYTLFDE